MPELIPSPMRPGEQRPFISQENVRAALDVLLYNSTEKTTNPLNSLILVDEFLANPDLPALQDAREYALAHILADLIIQGLGELRQTIGFHALSVDSPLSTATSELVKDAQTGSSELIGWDWLYYHYIRFDLNLSAEKFSQAVHVDERTLRRYQHHALKRLTSLLADAEWRARAAQRKRRLLSALPHGSQPVLYGRDELLASMEKSVSDNFPQVFYLTGAAGVGKSALTEAFLRRLVQAGLLDVIIWLERPDSTGFAREKLVERLLPEAGHISLREYLFIYRSAIVVDDIARLQHTPEQLQQLLIELSPALVMLTSQRFVPSPGTTHIDIPELNQTDAERLITHYLQAGQGAGLTDRPTRMIWQQSGGNPLAIQLIAQNLRFYQHEALPGSGIERLFDTIYGYMNDRLKQNWFMFALFHPLSVTSKHCLSLWPHAADDAAIQSLRQWHVLEISSTEGYRLSSAASQYIKARSRSDRNARELIYTLLTSAETAGLQDGAIGIFENLLLDDWLQIEPERKKRWIREMWPEGLRREQWADWARILELDRNQSEEPEPEFSLAYGRCLRHLGKSAAAQEIFEQTVRQAGQNGNFLLQAAALHELAILLRYQGAYEKALTCITRAERTAHLLQDDNLYWNLQLERAQIAVEVRDLQAALSLLSGMPYSKRRQALLGEVYLTGGDWIRSQKIIGRLLSEETHTPGVQARLLTTLARSYESQGDLVQARHYSSLAMILLENLNEPFALARAQANMGALLLHSADSAEEAYSLLSRAEQTQAQLNDRTALETTRHNLQLARARFGS